MRRGGGMVKMPRRRAGSVAVSGSGAEEGCSFFGCEEEEGGGGAWDGGIVAVVV